MLGGAVELLAAVGLCAARVVILDGATLKNGTNALFQKIGNKIPTP